MRHEKWKIRIEQACKDAGTYETWYEDAIDTLSMILENRDKAQKELEKSGGVPVVEKTMGSGAVNMVQNPALVIITELNKQALQFWRELGLTAKAFQAMQKNGFKKPEASFEEILADIGI